MWKGDGIMESVLVLFLGAASVWPAAAGQSGTAALAPAAIPVMGACCLPDGGCIETTQEDCTAQGGTYWFGGEACTPDICEYIPGACCGEYGDCVDTDWWSCVRYYPGHWFIQGHTCAEVCTFTGGACCLRDGSCEVIPEEYLCTYYEQGIWLGQIPCTPDPCSANSGAAGQPSPPIRFLARPNPFTSKVTFTLTTRGAGWLEIFDVAGRSVRRLAFPAAGPAQLRWDGRDSRGMPVPAGIFLAWVRQGEASRTLHLLKLD
jgi:hypothetical protein